MDQKFISLKFLKMEIKSNIQVDYDKVTILLSSQFKMSGIKKPKLIKNNNVNFFGESFIIPFAERQFSIIIAKINREGYQEEIGRINMTKQDIMCLGKKYKGFIGENLMFILEWQAKLIFNDTLDESDSDNTERDLPEISHEIHHYLKNSRLHLKNSHSPLIRKPPRVQYDCSKTNSDSPTQKKKEYHKKIDEKKQILSPRILKTDPITPNKRSRVSISRSVNHQPNQTYRKSFFVEQYQMKKPNTISKYLQKQKTIKSKLKKHQGINFRSISYGIILGGIICAIIIPLL